MSWYIDVGKKGEDFKGINIVLVQKHQDANGWPQPDQTNAFRSGSALPAKTSTDISRTPHAA